MTGVFLIARILFVAVFVIAPLEVMRNSAAVAKAPPLRRVPVPRVSVILASAAAILGGVLVIAGLWPDLGALLIAAYLVPVTLVMHAFWTFDDTGQRQSHRDSLLLNVSVFGGCLLLFWALNQGQHVPVAVVSAPLFNRW